MHIRCLLFRVSIMFLSLSDYFICYLSQSCWVYIFTFLSKNTIVLFSFSHLSTFTVTEAEALFYILFHQTTESYKMLNPSHWANSSRDVIWHFCNNSFCIATQINEVHVQFLYRAQFLPCLLWRISLKFAGVPQTSFALGSSELHTVTLYKEILLLV